MKQDLHPAIAAEVEKQTKDLFLKTAEGALAWQQTNPGTARRTCRAMLAAAYQIAFEHYPREYAVRMLAEALNALNAEQAKKADPTA